MGWQFCPRCESQLDEETLTCPSCTWDAKAFRPISEPEPEISFIEKYNGTPYLAPAPRPPIMALGRTRILVLSALLAVAALYGSMMIMVDSQSRTDRPATVHGLTQP